MMDFALAVFMAFIEQTLAEYYSSVGPHYEMSDAPQGKVFVRNYCVKDFYAYHTTAFDDPNPENGIALKAGHEISFPVIIPERGCQCGTSIKLFEAQTKSGKQTQMEYSIRDVGDRKDWFISYDISFVDCATSTPGVVDTFFKNHTGRGCPGWDEGVKVYGTNGRECGAMQCSKSKFCPWDAYFEPEPAKGTENPYQPVRQCAAGSIDADIHFVLCSGTTSDGGDPAIPGYRAPPPDDGPNATLQHFSASSPSPSPPLASLVHQGTSPLYSPADDGVTTRYAAAPAIVTIEVTGTALLSEDNVAKIKEHLDWVTSNDDKRSLHRLGILKQGTQTDQPPKHP
ncbi:hypothetical protein EJ05DRAFT_506013 [Pseudovirgaria hyperparasitica]|uniref:Osmotin, thaumatin-like protein n=1 Tax=Pseudovirgaria hyperparasitica TaxID=470096 RepID=A0A6A6VRT7_9PEZI|nr:uncharacterized protein EJ05DRAFT_506013 [Pseudovirgaria hyperparasitica]KAF2752474.1 hypothetical protein EJ05DRAFT_506013 [Pseudovirgaria hyperparasitica]